MGVGGAKHIKTGVGGGKTYTHPLKKYIHPPVQTPTRYSKCNVSSMGKSNQVLTEGLPLPKLLEKFKLHYEITVKTESIKKKANVLHFSCRHDETFNSIRKL